MSKVIVYDQVSEQVSLNASQQDALKTFILSVDAGLKIADLQALTVKRAIKPEDNSQHVVFCAVRTMRSSIDVVPTGVSIKAIEDSA